MYFKIYRKGFQRHSGFWVYGYLVKEDDTKVDYVRDSLTRWTFDLKAKEQFIEISESSFYNAVQECALNNGQNPPTDAKIKEVLTAYKDNYDIEFSEILKIFNNE